MINRRFAELATKAHTVAQQKKYAFTGDSGQQYFKVPSGPFKEWATNVLNLLQRTFGEESVHYRHFSDHYARFTE